MSIETSKTRLEPKNPKFYRDSLPQKPIRKLKKAFDSPIRGKGVKGPLNTIDLK